MHHVTFESSWCEFQVYDFLTFTASLHVLDAIQILCINQLVSLYIHIYSLSLYGHENCLLESHKIHVASLYVILASVLNYSGFSHTYTGHTCNAFFFFWQGEKIMEESDLEAIGITSAEHRKKILDSAKSLPQLTPIGTISVYPSI